LEELLEEISPNWIVGKLCPIVNYENALGYKV
jgi:hypothetical protein